MNSVPWNWFSHCFWRALYTRRVMAQLPRLGFVREGRFSTFYSLFYDCITFWDIEPSWISVVEIFKITWAARVESLELTARRRSREPPAVGHFVKSLASICGAIIFIIVHKSSRLEHMLSQICQFHVMECFSLGTATAIRYGVDVSGFEPRWGNVVSLLHTPLYRPSVPPSLLHSWYQWFFMGVEWPGRGADPHFLSAYFRSRKERKLTLRVSAS
jgi:hypothetical protein